MMWDIEATREAAKRWAVNTFISELFDDGAYTPEEREADRKLSFDIVKTVGELHVGDLHIIAVDIDEQIFIVRFDGEKGISSLEWRDE
jgi:hypothetical protein